MKFTLPKLKIGQRVFAEVKEVMESGEVIVNFAGDLLRIQNKTLKVFSLGDQIELEIRAIKPLQFRLVTGDERNLGRISFRV